MLGVPGGAGWVEVVGGRSPAGQQVQGVLGGGSGLGTELLSPHSTQYPQPSIADDAERTKQTIEAWQGMDGKQGGDPAKLTDALVELAALEEPPARFAAGVDAVATFEQTANELLAQA